MGGWAMGRASFLGNRCHWNCCCCMNSASVSCSNGTDIAETVWRLFAEAHAHAHLPTQSHSWSLVAGTRFHNNLSSSLCSALACLAITQRCEPHSMHRWQSQVPLAPLPTTSARPTLRLCCLATPLPLLPRQPSTLCPPLACLVITRTCGRAVCFIGRGNPSCHPLPSQPPVPAPRFDCAASPFHYPCCHHSVMS